MSVLVEALSLVVQRITLDVAWAGGADAFLEAMCAADCPARRLCADDRLVSVSFFTPDEAMSVVERLREEGLGHLEGLQHHDLALVDQHEGPTMPCAWLEWRRHPDGFSYVWLAGTEPGDMAAPVDWEPEQSRRLTRADLRDEPGRMLKLAEEGDLETWLDFQTGEVTVGLKRLAERVASAEGVDQRREGTMARREEWKDADDEESLLDVVKSAFAEREIRFDAFEDNALCGALRTDVATYQLFASVDDERDTVGMYLSFATRVPEARRVAVAELCSRINREILIGNLDVDFADGDLRWRAGIDVEEGVLSPTMVDNMLGAGVWTLDRFHDALMKVIVSGALPEAALREVTG